MQLKSDEQDGAPRGETVTGAHGEVANRVAEISPMTITGEVVGKVRGGSGARRWATLMEGECAIEVEALAEHWPPDIDDGSLLQVTASAQCEHLRGGLKWVVDDDADGTAIEKRPGQGEKAQGRAELRDELNLPASPKNSISGVASSRSIRKIMLLHAGDSQVLPDFKGALERDGLPHKIETFSRITGVQGSKAVTRLVRQLRQVTERDADLVVIIRGGGSPADFHVFNEKALVTAVRSCRVPVVTALGHSEHVPLAAHAAAANFSTPSAAGEAVRGEVWRIHGGQRASRRELEGSLAQSRKELATVQKRCQSLFEEKRRIEELLAEESQRVSDLRRDNQQASEAVSKERQCALQVSLDCAVQCIRFTALVRGLWGFFWAAVVGTVLGFDQGASWFVALSVTAVLAAWAAYILTGGPRAQGIRETHASQLPDGPGFFERRYAELALVRTPRALRRWYARLESEHSTSQGA